MTAMDFRNAIDARAFVATVLEQYAEEVFAPTVIAIRVQRAMRYGFLSTQVPQDRAVNLKGTQAAANLVGALLKLGYEVTWTDVRRIEQGRKGEPQHEYVYPELVIMWHERVFSALPDPG